MVKSKQRAANCKQKFNRKLLKIRNMQLYTAAPEFVLINACNDYTLSQNIFLEFASAMTVEPLK